MSLADIQTAADTVRANTSTRQDVADALETVADELDDFLPEYQANSVNQSSVSTTSNTYVQMGTTELTVDVAENEGLKVEFDAMVSGASAGDRIFMKLRDTTNGQNVGINDEVRSPVGSTTGSYAFFRIDTRYTPAAGTITIRPEWLIIGSSTAYSRMRSLKIWKYRKS